MKYIIIILFFLFSIGRAIAQNNPSNPKTQFSTGWFDWGWAQADSGLILSNRTPTFTPRFPGTVILYQHSGVDSNINFWNGARWIDLIPGFDSTSLSNRINLKLNISDTSTMLSSYLRKIDTTNKWVTSVYRKVASDSVFYVKGGQSIFAFKDSVGSGGSGLTSVGLSMPSAFTVTNSPLISNGTLNVIGAGTVLQYVRGNGTLATTDTSMIPNFWIKVRSLFSGTSPITYSNGAIGILNANTSGTKGAATFSSSNFSDNGSGLISLKDVVTAGSCTGCNVTFNSKGQATSFTNGSILLASNGLYKINDTVVLGTSLPNKIDSNVFIGYKANKYIGAIGTGVYISNVKLDSVGLWNNHSTVTGITSFQQPGLTVTGYYSEAANDTLFLQYNSPISTQWFANYDSSSVRYKQPGGTGMFIPYTGYSATVRFFPPSDSVNVNAWKNGGQGSAFVADFSIGKRWGYHMFIFGDTNHYPLAAFKSHLDLQREIVTSGNRVMRGTGVASFFSNFKNFQGNIDPLTTESHNYQNKIFGFYNGSEQQGFTISGTKAHIMAVSQVDTLIAFYADTGWTNVNSVNNAYSLVAPGLNDYGWVGGYWKVGGTMPSTANTQTFRLQIDSTVRIGAFLTSGAFFTKYWRRLGITNSNYGSTNKLGEYMLNDYSFDEDVNVISSPITSQINYLELFIDSSKNLESFPNSTGTTALQVGVLLRKKAGYLDTSTFVGGRNPLWAIAPLTTRMDMSATSVSGRENIATGYWSAFTPTFQFSAFNQMQHAIWLNVGCGQFNGAAGNITNGYGLFINGFPSLVTNKYAMYQDGLLDTVLLKGLINIPNLIAQSDTTSYKPVVVDALGNVSKFSYWPSTGGITSLNTLTATTQTFATSTSGSDFTISSSSSTHTFNIPSASTSNRGLVTTTSQTFGGGKTFNDGAVVTFPSGGAGTSLVVSGDRTLGTAPGIAGIGLQLASFTYTNTEASTTESGAQNFHLINTPTLTSSNAVTYSGDVSTIRFVGSPIAGGSSTISHPWNIFANDVNYFQTLAMGLNEQSGDATLGNGSIPIYTGSGGNTFTLPALSTHPGKTYFIKNAGSGNLTVARAGSDNLWDTSSVTSITLAAGAAAIISAGSSFWYVQKTE